MGGGGFGAGYGKYWGEGIIENTWRARGEKGGRQETVAVLASYKLRILVLKNFERLSPPQTSR